jgi:hypothetical protein
MSFGLAQITVSGNNSISVGDTIFTAIDRLPSRIHVTDSGPDQYWDFSSLMAPYLQQYIVAPVKDDQAFATVSNVSFMAKEQGIYETEFEMEIPFSDPPYPKFPAAYIPPLPFQMPMQYGDTYTYEGKISSLIFFDDLASKLPRSISHADTLRLVFDISEQSFVDAWGIVQLPYSSYQVLRQKIIRDKHGYLEKKIDGVWNDISYILEDQDFLKHKTENFYRFWSEDEPVPIAELTCDSGDQVKSVQFNGRIYGLQVMPEAPSRPDIFVYPNPSFGSVRFDFVNLPGGKYFLEIYNILGVKLKSEEVMINGTKTLGMDLSELKKGTYIYRLIDFENNPIRSKRLVIITP